MAQIRADEHTGSAPEDPDTAAGLADAKPYGALRCCVGQPPVPPPPTEFDRPAILLPARPLCQTSKWRRFLPADLRPSPHRPRLHPHDLCPKEHLACVGPLPLAVVLAAFALVDHRPDVCPRPHIKIMSRTSSHGEPSAPRKTRRHARRRSRLGIPGGVDKPGPSADGGLSPAVHPPHRWGSAGSPAAVRNATHSWG